MSTAETSTPDPAEPADAAPNSPERSSQQLVPRNTAFAVALIGMGLGLAIGLVIGLAVIPSIRGVASGIVTAAQPSPITSAVETCDVEANRWIEVGDEGKSLSMQSLGEESSGAEFTDVFCVLNELNTPDSVLNRINSTRALDGRQTADWTGFSASWGYHPENGLDIVIDVERK